MVPTLPPTSFSDMVAVALALQPTAYDTFDRWNDTFRKGRKEGLFFPAKGGSYEAEQPRQITWQNKSCGGICPSRRRRLLGSSALCCRARRYLRKGAVMTNSDSKRAPVGALSGVRILDLGRVLAAPWGTQILADLGAEVIKVERLGVGSDERAYGPKFMPGPEGRRSLHSAFHNCANRNKKSIAIDLSSSRGRDLVLALAVECDVLVENFVPGKARKLGLDYEAVRAVHPGIVYASLSGYGQTGPLSDRPGYDAIFQARSGLMSLTGIPDGQPGAGPMRIGPSLVDVTTGYNLAIAILGALYHRDALGGQGQQIDVALMDTAIAIQSHALANYLLSGEQPPRQGSAGNGGHPSQVFECLDGCLYISAGQDQFFASLCVVLGCEDETDDT